MFSLLKIVKTSVTEADRYKRSAPESTKAYETQALKQHKESGSPTCPRSRERSVAIFPFDKTKIQQPPLINKHNFNYFLTH
jgi:hypothetical protein